MSHTQYGDVPLEIAARQGHIQTVQRLLEARADVNQQNKVMTIIYLLFLHNIMQTV